jgi:hypothetical protein
MKINLKKIGAVVAGATILASSAAFAGLMFGSTTLVDDSGMPVAKVVIGSNAKASDAVAASLIAGKMVSEAYKSQTLTAELTGEATCIAAEEGTGTCAISDEKARLEITVPGAVVAGTWTGENLIGDYLNRELLDRVDNVPDGHDDYTDAAYDIGGSDTSESANPFTNGDGAGNIGVSEVYLYKIDGGEFSPFVDQTLTDVDSGNTYVEMQAMWLQGDNHFDTDPDDVVGRLEFLAYSLKFDGPGGDEIGIPVCTQSEDDDFTFCKGTDGDIDDATETHRLKVFFLGEEWIISEMNAPNNDPSTAAADGLTNENQLVNGGSVKLAKESVSGILNQGESLPVDDLKFQLDDLEAHGDTVSAILSVLDANGNVLKKDKVNPGQTKEFNVQGKTYRFHVYKVAPGYTFGAKWADVAIFSEELELEDGQDLDSDNNSNPDYQVALGWKNVDASSGLAIPDGGNPEQADALRTIVIYGEDVEDLASGGEENLEVGDYVPLVQDPVAWKLSYKGLDITGDDRFSLKFEIETSDKDISASKGPVTGCSDGSSPSGSFPTTCGSGSPVQAACKIYAPYVKVSSGDTGSVFSVDRSDAGGELSDDEFYVALCTDPGGGADACFPGVETGGFEAVACDANNDGDPEDDGFFPYWAGAPGGPDVALTAGTVFMRLSPSSDDYGFLDYLDSQWWLGPGYNKPNVGTEVRYEDIADGDNAFAPPKGGAILIEDEEGLFWSVWAGGDNQLGSLLYSAGWFGTYTGDVPDFYFAVAEKAGTGTSNDFVDYFVFGVDETSTGAAGDATFDFDSDDGVGFTTTSDDEEVLYGHALSDAILWYDLGCGATPSGPVTCGVEMVEEQYISERGSVFESIDSDTVEFDMAHTLARAQWFLSSEETEGEAGATIVTLGEGESTTISGVTVKVLEITETVGACTAAGGGALCAADMSTASAMIMPDSAASVEAAMPADFGSYGNLVILDEDAVGVNTLVSVGGDRVNTVTANLLAEAPVDWTTETKVVREVVEGSKIVVAGKEADDTLEAAQDFVAQLQKV